MSHCPAEISAQDKLMALWGRSEWEGMVVANRWLVAYYRYRLQITLTASLFWIQEVAVRYCCGRYAEAKINDGHQSLCARTASDNDTDVAVE